MDKYKRDYYQKMIKKDRLVPVYEDKRLLGMITFYIGNGDATKYIRDDMWSIVEDEPKTGKTCYVDHCVTDRNPKNKKHSFIVFKKFIIYIKQVFPQVEEVRWNRFKKGVSYVRRKSIRKRRI